MWWDNFRDKRGKNCVILVVSTPVKIVVSLVCFAFPDSLVISPFPEFSRRLHIAISPALSIAKI